MENQGEHNFETFLREALENYEAPYTSDWSTMENRLEKVNISNPSIDQEGILKSTIFKAVLGITSITLVIFLLLNFTGNDNTNIKSSNIDNKQSILDKLRSYKSDRDTYIKTIKQNYLSDETSEVKSLKAQELNSSDKNQIVAKEVIKEDKTNLFVSSKVIEKTPIIKVEGPTLDMLRREYQNEKMLPTPIVEFSANKTDGCMPLLVQFKMEKKDVAVSYLWNFGDGNYSTEANPSHLYFYAGRYNVLLTSTSLINQNLMAISESQIINVYKLPEIKFNWDNSQNDLGHSEFKFVDQSTDAIEWYWDFGDNNYSIAQNPSHTYTENGSYNVKLVGRNRNGCLDTVASQVRILGDHLSNKFFAPNAFTPNGDGSNDDFKLVIIGAQSLDFEMSIYDRNGNLIFETNDVNIPWDGRMKEDGRIAPTGTYIWLAVLKNKEGKQEKQIGQVTLIQ